jgi:RNA polymerase sigma factor (TIGR02999 family)
MADIAQLLSQMRNGSAEAGSTLVAQVYGELRRLASSYMRRERPDHTLQTTALVHEAYLRLVGQRELDWHNRAQLLGIAAQSMRRVLMDHARAHESAKRGGPQFKVSLSHVGIKPLFQSAQLLALDDALTELAKIDARQSRIVELRFFSGLTEEQTAEVLGISPRTVRREWTFARAWLFHAVSPATKAKRE